MVEREHHPSNRTRRIRAADGFDLARVSDEQGDYPLAPPECKSLAEIRFETDPPDLEATSEDQGVSLDEPLPRFTVLELMIFVAFAAVGLSAVRWLPPNYFAGAASALAVIALVVDRVWKPKNALGRWMIWGVVIIYFSAAIGAALLHGAGEADPATPAENRNPHARP